MPVRRLVLALTLVLVTTACSTAVPSGPDGAPTTTADPDQGATFTAALATEPDTLNPLLGYAPHGDGTIFEGLVGLGPDLRPRPVLATDLPEVSEDGLVYTFTLRDGVTFHDGEPMDAADVVFTYTEATRPGLESPVASTLAALDRVEATDGRTVVFHLDYPYAPFLVSTTLGIVPEHLLDGEDLTDTAFNREPVGTGPYAVESWRSGEQLVLTAHEGHRDGPADVGRAVFLFVGDDATRAARVAAGDVDAAVLPPPLLPRFEGDEGWQVHRVDTADFRAVALPAHDNPVTSDPVLRRALGHAVDRQAMVDAVLAGAGRPAYSPVPPEHPAYQPGSELEHDPGLARRLLDEAGWATGPDGVRERDGVRARFTLMYPAQDTLRQGLALAFQSAAAEVGVQVDLEGLSWEAIQPRMRTDAVVFGQGSPYDPDLTLYSQFHSSLAYQGFENPGGYSSEEVDRLLEEGRRVRDEADRAGIYQQVQELLARDQPWVFLAFVDHGYVLREGWGGYEPVVEPHEHGLNGGPWWDLTALSAP